MVASQIGLRDPDQHAAVAAALREAARKKLETFPDDIECIRALCRDCDPLALLSVIGSYGATYAIKAVERFRRMILAARDGDEEARSELARMHDFFYRH